MFSVRFTAIFLVVSLPVCAGHADSPPGTLLSRIEALETRDAEQSARIELLEEQAKISRDKHHQLSASNNNLQQNLAATTKKLEEYEDNVALVQKELESKNFMADSQSQITKNLESEMKKLRTNLEDTYQKLADNKNRCKEQINEIKAIHQTQMKQDSSSMARDTIHEGASELTSEDNANNNLDKSEDETTQAATDKSTLIWTNTSAFNTPREQLDGANGETTHTDKQLKTRQRKNLHHSRFVVTTDMVAFHAVLTPHGIYHLGTNDNIRFDTIFLNEGDGYHNQHGLFIAPKSGFYLFSVTIATYYDAPFYAAIVKNGVILANLAGDGEKGLGSYLDQGSVTIVTKLNVGDEVWVKHVSPPDGSIWGNLYSTFAGVLLAEF